MLVCDTVVTGSLFVVLDADAIRVGRNSQAQGHSVKCLFSIQNYRVKATFYRVYQVFGGRFFVHFIRERENPAFGCLV